MSDRKDSVFQLSLTEIAFTIIFILLLLLGYMVAKEQAERRRLEQQVSKLTSEAASAQAIKDARREFETAIAASGGLASDDVITRLVEASRLRSESRSQQRRIADLDARLTALQDLRNELAREISAVRSDLREDTIERILAVVSSLEKSEHDEEGKASSKSEEVNLLAEKLNEALAISSLVASEIPSEDGATTRLDAVREALQLLQQSRQAALEGPSIESTQRENVNLKGQLAFLRNRLAARGGRDFPPCWADEKTGKVQFIFNVVATEQRIGIRPAWPSERDSDARSIPGVDALAAAEEMSHKEFVEGVQGVFALSEKQGCRHYVQFRSDISDAVASDRTRLMVENYFYKLELRR